MSPGSRRRKRRKKKPNKEEEIKAKEEEEEKGISVQAALITIAEHGSMKFLTHPTLM